VIASAGIKRVYYKLRYRRDTEGIALQFLRNNNISVYLVDDIGNISQEIFDWNFKLSEKDIK
jgi:deoxycytidylate deaminase